MSALTPLGALPGGNPGGGNTAQNEWYSKTHFRDSFKQMFGRDATNEEELQFLPQYMQSLHDDSGYTAGDAALASYYQQQQNTPTALAAKQQSDALTKYKAGQGDYDAQTQQIFQQSVGRNATADELSHFGSLLASGQIDQYGMTQLVGQTAEAQNAATAKYQKTLGDNLQGVQADYFKNYINPTILSQTAAAGRDPNSSGVQQAQVQAGKQQNYDLQNYLANFGASQYGQAAQNQQNVYQQYLNQQYGLQNANINSQLQNQSYLQQRNTDLANYQMQQNAYNTYLQNYGKRSGVGSMISGGLSGAGSGAMMGSTAGPWGALAGGILGGGLGVFGGSQSAKM
jgi:hypothetical protein